jgi:hypothetical protein
MDPPQDCCGDIQNIVGTHRLNFKTAVEKKSFERNIFLNHRSPLMSFCLRGCSLETGSLFCFRHPFDFYLETQGLALIHFNACRQQGDRSSGPGVFGGRSPVVIQQPFFETIGRTRIETAVRTVQDVDYPGYPLWFIF